MYIKFENNPLKTVEVVITQTPYPIVQETCRKYLSFKGDNSVKINFIFIKT